MRSVRHERALCILTFWYPLVIALEHCSLELGGGTCPTGNTCCYRRNGVSHRRSSSSCIANDLGSINATCCSDNGTTGCAVGYTCRYTPYNDCLADAYKVTDPLVQTLPRYRLCHAPQIATVQGLAIFNDAKLAYYSSHGDIQRHRTNQSIVTMTVIVVHGSGRNADDYFCSMLAAAQRQSNLDAKSILVVAPRFPIASDGDLDLVHGGTALVWSDSDPNGPWRYGASASAVAPPSVANRSLSSFDAMDRIVATLLDPTRYPHLQRITMVGHSSGGQFVQRWSLLSPTWNAKRMRAVVANPSSYVYLTPQRYIQRAWRYPETNCSDYNEWEWGLDQTNRLDALPYVQSIVQHLGLEGLKSRFATRTVVYLVGSLDVCNTTSTDSAWCNSHGLETTCRDMLQGSNRFERFLLYLAMLEHLGLSHVGRIVPGVGHDHSLVFHSDMGLDSIFGSIDDNLHQQSNLDVVSIH